MKRDVLEFGADPTGSVHSHEAINHALSEVSAGGGGTVVVSPGRYLCGTLHLRSGVRLHLESGARIVGTGDLSLYKSFDPPDSAEGHLGAYWHRALILAEGVVDAGITGPGEIDGAKVFDPKGEEKMRGPHTLLVGNSSRLVFRDFTVVDSANYAVLAEYSDDLEFLNLRIRGGWDGIHVRGRKEKSCGRITIERCDFQTGDDAIAGRYWDDFLVKDCVINSSCNGIRVIGPATGLVIEGCLFTGPGRYPHVTQNRVNALAGILLQPGSWDPTVGRLDDVLIANCVMRHLQCPIAAYVKRGNTAGTVVVDGLKAYGVYGAACSFESWAETPIERVVMRDVTVEFTEAARSEVEVPEAETEPHVGIRDLPGWGLHARRVERLDLDNVRMYMPVEDARPALHLREVEKVERRLTELWAKGRVHMGRADGSTA